MRRRAGMVTLLLTIVLTAGCVGGLAGSRTKAAPQTEPYAGLATRPIKALAPERVEDLLAGRGAGYALAAELNHHPGPMHVLELTSELQLRPDQEQRVREVFSAMQQDARQLGRQLVDSETQLDRAFSERAITPAKLARLTAEVAMVEGQLRNAHLAAHLEMRNVLTPEQLVRYDQLRGYTKTDTPVGEDMHSPGQHGGSNGRH